MPVRQLTDRTVLQRTGCATLLPTVRIKLTRIDVVSFTDQYYTPSGN